jgi:hypothetical protein
VEVLKEFECMPIKAFLFVLTLGTADQPEELNYLLEWILKHAQTT